VLVQDVHRRWVATELDWKCGPAGRRESDHGAGTRVVYELGVTRSPLELASRVLRIFGFSQPPPKSHPSSRPPPSFPIIVEFGQCYPVEDLNIIGYADVTGAEVV